MTAYVTQTWNDDDPATPLSAARLTHIEQGILAASQAVTSGQVLVIGTSDSVPVGTPAGTLIVRTASPTTPPTAITLSGTASSGQVVLSLTGGSGATSFALYRGSTPTGTPIATAFPFTDAGRTNGTTYTYVATATNSGGTVTSNVVTATPASSSTPATTTAITKVASLQAQAGGVSNTITVPAGVTTSHMCLVVIAGASAYTAGDTITMSDAGWTQLSQNNAAFNNSEVAIFKRLGGYSAGQTIPYTQSSTNGRVAYAIWYDTQGHDLEIVGTVGGRGGVSSSTTTIPGITTTKTNQIILVVASERTTATGTTVSGTSPTATVDYFAEDTTSSAVTNTSIYFGHFTQASPGATGNEVITYSGGSGNGAGLLLALP